MKQVFIDARAPGAAIRKLSEFADPVRFITRGITYDSISGHPDIFIARVGDVILAAPNLPEEYKDVLRVNGIPFTAGELPAGDKYPNSARYNIVATQTHLFHNFRYTDSSITDAAGQRDLVHVNQGYCRCNLLALNDTHFITSDRGIYSVLGYVEGLSILLVPPGGILLPGHGHGFIGGTAGIHAGKIFFTGSLDRYPAGDMVRDFISPLGLEIVELYDGPLFDGGGVMFV